MMPFVLAFVVCGVLNWGYAYTLGFALLVVGLPLMRRRKIWVNFIAGPAFWLLAAFGLSYAALDGFSFDIIQNALLLPLAAYAIGWCGVESAEAGPEAARDGILAIAAGFAVHAALNYFINTGHNRGQLVDFWSGSYWTATASGFLNTIALSLFVYVLFVEQRRWIKALLLAMLAVCLLYMFQLGNRAQLLILAAVSLLGGALLLGERAGTKTPARVLLGGVFALGLILACWRFNWLGLADRLAESNLFVRLAEQSGISRSNSERAALFAAGLRNLYRHPFGGQKAQYYFHNMWLDIGRVSGLIPMLLMLLYNALTLGHAVRLFRTRRLDTGARYVILCTYLGVLMNFCFEPVLEGLVGFFLAFCMVNGITESLSRSRRTAGEDERREA